MEDELLTRRDWETQRARLRGLGLGAALDHANRLASAAIAADPHGADWDVERWTAAEWEGIERTEALDRRLRRV